MPDFQYDFQSIFSQNYPGADSFINDVLTPIFPEGAIEKSRVPVDILNTQEKRTRANFVNIKSILNIAEIDIESLASSIQIYDVTLDDHCQLSRSRVGIQQLVRAEVQAYTNIFILFHYESSEGREWRFSYAFKGASQADITPAKRYTYLFGKEHNSRTANDRFNNLCGKEIDEALLQEAFSVEALSKEFFDDYKAQYEKFCQFLYDHKNDPHYFGQEFHDYDDDKCDDYVKKMLGRILFLQFIQKKGWMCGDPNYTRNLFKKTKYQDDFLDRVLEPLFFGVLNTAKSEREELFKKKKWDLQLLDEWQEIPYLNGGLFEPDYIDPPKSVFDKSLYEELFDLFDRYNFTIDENDPDDAEVGVDPEMLGKIFENQLKDNKGKGAFYTPKEIVQYMCRESLIAYLTTSCPRVGKDVIRKFILTHEFPEEHREALDKALQKVKICDPAIGSGAFPMGMLHELYKCHTALSDEINQTPTEIKRFIIQNSIYGVDIEKGAVDIARLRFWLSLVVTEECEEGKDPDTLPNLDYKIMQGNSLLESWQGMNLKALAQTKRISVGDLQMTIFSQGQDFTRFKLEKAINDYYDCHDRNLKKEIRTKIEEYIKVQLHEDWNNHKDKINIDFDLRANDKLFLWHTWFVDVFSNEGFDIVIGNPPYIRQESLTQDYKKVLNKEYEHIGNGTADLFVYFFGLGINLLKKDGVLTFITSNKYLKTLYGMELRNYLSKYTTVDLIIDFFELPVFKSASVDAAIAKIFKTPRSDSYLTRYFPIQTLEKLDLEKITQGPYLITLRDLNEWKFIEPQEERLIRKIEGPECMFLTLFVKGRIYRGITTGLNKAFVIKDKEIAQSLLNSESRPLVKKYAHSTDITKWGLKDEKYFLATGFDLDIEKQYPTAFQYLQQFKPELEVRCDQGRHYFNLRACDYYDEFEKEKIIYIRTAKNHQFYFDTEGHYVNDSCYIIVSNSKFLFCFLNSKLFNYYKKIKFVAFGDGKEDGRCKLDANKMVAVPIMPNVDEAPFTALFEKIQAIKKKNPRADVSAEERAIDELVYSLYGLTAEEIAIVEGTTPPVGRR